MKKVWVISLGGSRIVPDEVDEKFLVKFKKLIDSHPSHKFVAVTGGGSTARRYISALRKLGKTTKSQSMSGIAITRLHAEFMAGFFGKSANEVIPKSMKEVKNLLNKNQIVFCGALRYGKGNTSDGTSAKISAYLDCPFINLTNVKGLYTSNPKENKNAKFIGKVTWKKFEEITGKMRFKAGQHFVLDQSAAEVILKEKISTYIVGSLTAIDKVLKGKGGFWGDVDSWMKDINLFRIRDSIFLKKIKSKLEILEKDDCDGYLIEASENEIRKIITSLKGKKLIAIVGGENVFNRRAIETLKINYLVSPERGLKRDSLKQRDSGLNHVVAKEAAKRDIVMVVDFSEVSRLVGKAKALRLERLIQNIKVCRKARCSIRIASFAEMNKDVVDEKGLSSFGVSLGMSSEQSRDAVRF